MFKFLSKLLITLFFINSVICPCRAQQNLSIIRDAEIEQAIKDAIEPIFKAANIESDAVSIHIINSSQINAFVASGMNIFINSGLLLKWPMQPEVLIGVVAHELGHIKNGHLARASADLQNIQNKTLTTAILGLAASALSGSSELAAAWLVGTMHVGERSMLHYSRENEQAADLVAVELLNKAKISSSGLETILKYLKQTEGIDINPYTKTHPLSRERIIFIKNYTKNTQSVVDAKVKDRFQLAMSKLQAFLLSPTIILKQTENSTDLPFRYGRAIALYRSSDITSSIKIIDELIRQYPSNPYIFELKGQILLENGKANQAVTYYQKAVELLPSSSLLKLELAIAQINCAELKTENRKRLLKQSIDLLQQIITQEPENIMALDHLAIAYGRIGQMGQANLALAKKFILIDKKSEAVRFAKIAMSKLPNSSTYYTQASDIISSCKNDKTS